MLLMDSFTGRCIGHLREVIMPNVTAIMGIDQQTKTGVCLIFRVFWCSQSVIYGIVTIK